MDIWSVQLWLTFRDLEKYSKVTYMKTVKTYTIEFSIKDVRISIDSVPNMFKNGVRHFIREIIENLVFTVQFDLRNFR